MEPIEAVIFDVNETLTDLTPMRERFVEHGLAAHQVDAWFASVLREGFALTSVQQIASFANIGGELLHGLLRADIPAEALRDEAVTAILSAFSSLPVHDDVPEAIRDLAARGHTLVTLSNGSAKVATTVLEAADLTRHFDSLLSVEDAGIWKPAGGAYAYALKHGGWSAEESLLVACHPWDLNGARVAGLATAWVNRTGASWPSYFAEPDLTMTDLRELPGLLTAPV